METSCVLCSPNSFTTERAGWTGSLQPSDVGRLFLLRNKGANGLIFKGQFGVPFLHVALQKNLWMGSFLIMIFLCNIAQRVGISKIGQFGQGARPTVQCL